MITHGYFPLSRAWAAASAAEGDADRFREETGTDLPPLARGSILPLISRLGQTYDAAMATWNEAFFAPKAPTSNQLDAAERARSCAAYRLMGARAAFLPWLRWLPPARWEIPRPEDVEARHGHRRRTPTTAYQVPNSPKVRVSYSIEHRSARRYWLRFRSPILGDTVSARVIEPIGVAEPPTMISLHGIGVETEFWPPGYEALDTLLVNGVRLVFPDGPWHGRRRPSGYFGGEPIIAQAPEGMLTCMQAWSAEVSMLIAWARSSGSLMVALGGISLGALTSQMVASVSAAWPKPLQPDAVFLVATSDNLLGVVFDGTLTGGVGLSQELGRAGWTRDNLRSWLPLLEPQGPPVTGPDRVVMVLGEADTVTPFAGGVDLAQRWNVPEDNLFLRRQGHFSVALGLASDPAPVNRLLELMRA